VDFDGDVYKTVTLTGNIDFASSTNRSAAKTVTIRIIGDGSSRTLAFHASWVFVGTKPTTIAASKVGILSVTCLGTAETDVIAAYAVST
jgi:hypothetical protein